MNTGLHPRRLLLNVEGFRYGRDELSGWGKSFIKLLSEVKALTFNPNLYPSWQKAGEYLVDSDRVYVGKCEDGTQRVYLEDAGVLYPLRQVTRVSSAGVDWTSDSGAIRLALSILLDATWGDIDLCEKLYKPFAVQVLNGLSLEGWRLRRDFVWAWIRLTLSV